MTRPPRFDRGPQYRARQRRLAWRRWRPLAVLALVLAAWLTWNNAAFRAGIGLPMPRPDEVSASFGLCAERGHASHCVVDGDTFRIGQRRIRVAGIDAPEIHGQCQAESEAARRATLALRDWLDDGPFLLDTPEQAPRDKYGRELQRPWREGSPGRREELADHMITTGNAREFGREGRLSWC